MSNFEYNLDFWSFYLSQDQQIFNLFSKIVIQKRLFWQRVYQYN